MTKRHKKYYIDDFVLITPGFVDKIESNEREAFLKQIASVTSTQFEKMQSSARVNRPDTV